jgi:electron transport complex protein RnfC
MSESLPKSLTVNMAKKIRRIWSFPGGVKLSGHKDLSNRHEITQADLPSRLIIPLSQHIGHAAEPVVKPGDKVLKGQLIAHAEGPISAPVHASSSGTVVAIEELAIPHPSGLNAPCIIIDTDGRDEWTELTPLIHQDSDLNTVSVEQIREKISTAGIVGLGGATFPSAAKLNPGQHSIDTIIVNAAECEPYITCDDMLMRSRPEEIIQGIRVMMSMTGAKQCLVGIEDNKPEAYDKLVNTLKGYQDSKIEIVKVPAIYPMGGEKQLIKVLTNKEVPSQGLPMDIGIICHNIATVAAIYRAVFLGEPLISRIVTLTGKALNNPQNMEVLVGTPAKNILAQAEMVPDKVEKIIIGGPMMGFSIPSINAPVTKAANCLLVSERGELSSPPPAMPCIRCARCADSCPMSLLPQQMYWYARAHDLEKVQDYNIFDCIECGCCSYACPSNIPLVQYFRYAKTEIWGEEAEKKKSDIARDRHEFRQLRLEKAAAAKAAAAKKRKQMLAKKKAAARDSANSDTQIANSDTQDNDDTLAENGHTQTKNGHTQTKKADSKTDSANDKADLIREAIARSQAKKTQQKARAKNTENLTSAQQRQIEAANKRRGVVESSKENTTDKQD